MAASMLFGFGVGLIGGGLWWHLIEDIILTYIAKYVYNSNDPYYLASDLIWHSIPFILMFVGIICLILGGLLGRSSRTVVYE